MNENFYKTQANWNTIISKKLKEKDCNLDYIVVPVNPDIKGTVAKIPNDVDSVFAVSYTHLTLPTTF